VTPYGKIGISICRDMSFPSFLRQAAKDNVDIMLSPSYDWPKSPAPWYLTSTIENGYSYAADYHGKELAHMDSDQTKEGILLGWLSVIMMFVLIGLAFFKKS
jgi:apolipoprotein N-acyltransferase